MKGMDKSNRYGIEITRLAEEDGGGYLAVFPQLGRMITGLGETREEALEDLIASVPTLAESFDEHGEKLPEPEVTPHWREYSGRVTLRVPRMLHAQLDRLAGAEDVSLNTLMLTMLQSGVTAMAAGFEFGAAWPQGVRYPAGSEPDANETATVRAQYDQVIRYARFFDRASGGYWEGKSAAQQAPRSLPDDWQIIAKEPA